MFVPDLASPRLVPKEAPEYQVPLGRRTSTQAQDKQCLAAVHLWTMLRSRPLGDNWCSALDYQYEDKLSKKHEMLCFSESLACLQPWPLPVIHLSWRLISGWSSDHEPSRDLKPCKQFWTTFSIFASAKYSFRIERTCAPVRNQQQDRHKMSVHWPRDTHTAVRKSARPCR